MKLRLLPVLSVLMLGRFAAMAQQPAGVTEALQGLSSQPSTHASITFDRDMLASADGFLNDGSGAPAKLNGITFESYRYHEPAFYIPENMHALVEVYKHAGWKHLVDANGPPKDSASPQKPLTDLWLHFRGGEIDDVTVLIRAPKQMNIITVSGLLRPLDLVHLSGHFGIPKVDPNAVMVPAPDGK